MRTSEKYLVVILSVLFVFNVQAQDIHFSQYNNAPMLVNPANAGSIHGDYRAVLNYKNQWSSINNAYETFGLSYDRGFFKKEIHGGFLGAGVNIMRDVAGVTKLSTTIAGLSLAYHVPLNREQYLTGAVQTGMIQYSIDYGSFKWDNQYVGEAGFDQSISSGENYKIEDAFAGDLSAGLIWNYRSREAYLTANDGLSVNLGIAAFHLNSPLISFYADGSNRLNSRYVFHGNAFIGLPNTNLGVMPSSIFMLQGNQKECIIGSLLRYNIREASRHTNFMGSTSVAFGGGYRVGDAFIIDARFEKSGFMIGFSYDINTSPLKAATHGRGGMELSLIYTGFKSMSASKY